MLKKRFGQNLLINKAIVKSIADCAEITKEDIVIEIGAGTGNLTKQIAPRAGKVFAFEIDKDFFPVLNKLKEEFPNVELILSDFLKYDLKQIFALHPLPSPHGGEGRVRGGYILVGNIPYNITSPIITKIFQKDILNNFSKIIFMTQLEYAKRLMAKPGGKDYGSITVFVKYYADAEIVRKVSKGNFKPVPKVDSAVIKITPLPAPRYECDEELLFKITRASFSQRRKKIINSLLNSEFFKNIAGTGRPSASSGRVGLSLRDAFESAGIKPDLRAEDLSLEDYVKLTKKIKLTF